MKNPARLIAALGVLVVAAPAMAADSLTLVNPPGVRPPSSLFSHSVRVKPGAERLVISGQVGARLDGSVPEGDKEQAAQALANLKAVLAGSGLTFKNLARITIYVTDLSVVPAFRAERDAAFAGHAPASTLVVVKGLANPAYKIEIEAEAIFP